MGVCGYGSYASVLWDARTRWAKLAGQRVNDPNSVSGA